MKIAGAATNLRACISFSHGRAGKEQGPLTWTSTKRPTTNHQAASTIWGCLKTGGYPKIISKYPKMHQNAIFERGNEVQAAEWNAVFPKFAFKPFGSCNNYTTKFFTRRSQNLSASNLQENHSFHGQFLVSCRFSPRSIHRIRNLTMFSPFVPYMFHRFPRHFPAISPCVPHRPGSTWPVPRWPWAAAGRRTGHCRRPRGRTDVWTKVWMGILENHQEISPGWWFGTEVYFSIFWE